MLWLYSRLTAKAFSTSADAGASLHGHHSARRDVSDFNSEQFFRISERNLFLGFAWQINSPEPVGLSFHVCKRVVGCKHHSIHTYVLQQEIEQFSLGECAGCEPEIFMEILLERLVQALLGHFAHLLHDAFVEERKPLSHMTDDNLELWIPVEYS